MIEIAIYLYIVGYVLTNSFEVMTLHIRLAGSRVGQNAYAAFMVTACMLGNRLGASLLFPSGGFLVDKGYPTAGLFNLFSIAAFSACAVLLVLYVFQNHVVILLERLFPETLKEALPSKLAKSNKLGNGTPISRSVVGATTSINQLGIFLPVLVASLFLDYRATIVQLGFFVNSVGTVINIFFVEKKIALNAEFAPDQLKRELRRILQVRIGVMLTFGLLATLARIYAE